jgi:hypothetical protein
MFSLTSTLIEARDITDQKDLRGKLRDSYIFSGGYRISVMEAHYTTSLNETMVSVYVKKIQMRSINFLIANT